MYLSRPFLSKMPSLTILKLSTFAPSSKIVVEVGGMDPGRIPPISAWWPREAVKKIISSVFMSNTGVMMVISGRCLEKRLDSGGARATFGTDDPPA